MSTNKRDVREFLTKAVERFKLAAEAEARIRSEALEDLRFRAGEQWPDAVKHVRDADKRPCLTINRLPQFLKQITNEQRAARPAVQVNPVGSGADEDTAEVLQGLVRHIENNSDAGVAYDTAFESACTGGFGYIRIVTDYQGDDWDQDIYIKRVRNPFTVYFDPACTEPDYSDARFAFVVEDIPRDEYKEQYPKSEAAGLQEFASIGDAARGWLTAGSVRVAEYFYTESETRTLCKLADGSLEYEDELTEGAQVAAKRTVSTRCVKWAKINALEVLEETDWPGRWIPIVPVLGDELDIDGQRQLVSLIRYARDPQRMYNYWVSAQTETIALAPRAPYIGVEGQFEGHPEWLTANIRNHPYLEYKPKGNNGTPAPPPQRQVFEAPIQAITAAISQAGNDLKSTTGIYDASLGAPGPEQSGKAILARKSQGDTANAHFQDNLARAIRHVGRILIDLIPHIYDTPRIVRVIGDDLTQKTVQVNAPYATPGGLIKLHDLTVGKYDVTVTTGPNYQSKRQEAVESMLQLTSAYPPLMQIAGDLVVRNMDWPGAEEVAERIKKTLPPALQGDDANAPQPPTPQMQALMQQHQALVSQLHKLLDERNAKTQELASKERIAAMNAQVALIQTEATINAQNAQALLKAEMGAIQHKLDLLTDHTQMGIDADQQQQQIGLQQQQQQQAAQAQQAQAQPAQPEAQPEAA